MSAFTHPPFVTEALLVDFWRRCLRDVAKLGALCKFTGKAASGIVRDVPPHPLNHIPPNPASCWLAYLINYPTHLGLRCRALRSCCQSRLGYIYFNSKLMYIKSFFLGLVVMISACQSQDIERGRPGFDSPRESNAIFLFFYRHFSHAFLFCE
jgi:hypothetical protein